MNAALTRYRSNNCKPGRVAKGAPIKPVASVTRPVGRPKGSQNHDKTQVTLPPELQLIQNMIRKQDMLINGLFRLTYLVLDGQFGNHNALEMTRQCELHLISKLRYDAALYLPYSGTYSGRGAPRKYGARLDYAHLPVACRKASVVEFNFRDAKQYWGLDGFMNVQPIPVTNAANLTLFMVNVAQRLLLDLHVQQPHASVLDLKAFFRGRKYVTETFKLLPEMPEPILMTRIYARITALGRIHQSEPALSSP